MSSTKQGITEGSVAITQNNPNATEDMVAKVFAEGMAKYCPSLHGPARRV